MNVLFYFETFLTASYNWQVLGEIAFLVKDDLQDYIDNKYATHFARSLLQLLASGLEPVTHHAASKSTPPPSERTGLEAKLAAIEAAAAGTVVTNTASVDSPLFAHVRMFANVVSGPQFDDDAVMTLQRSPCASPYLQLLLRCSQADQCASIFPTSASFLAGMSVR